MAPKQSKSKNLPGPRNEVRSHGEDTEVEETRKLGATRPDEMPAEVLEFITAIDEYKRQNRRPFPSWSEVLEILKALGYSRAG